MSDAGANPICRLPDPVIEEGPFRAMWRTDGRLALVDTRRHFSDQIIGLLELRPGLKSTARERSRLLEDEARVRVAELAREESLLR